MMQRMILSNTLRRFQGIARASPKIPMRSFANTADLTIDEKPLDHPEDAGVTFNESSIIPDGDAGTFQMPIMVPSQHESRFVGFEDPDSHTVRWFELVSGHPHYVPDIGLYFQLQYVEPVY